MDNNECKTVIPGSRGAVGLSMDEIVERLTKAGAQFGANAKAKFSRTGEWGDDANRDEKDKAKL